jgi:DUF1365 family protein
MHHRPAGPGHRFVYTVFMWLLDLAELPSLARHVPGFGYNRPGIVTFRDADHFDGSSDACSRQLRRVLESEGVSWPSGPVRVLTNCRMFGYVFNPVSFWFCYTPEARLDAIVAEVNNTFGERHCYVSARPDWAPACTVSDDDTKADGQTAGWPRWSAKKVFHVSPFLSLDGTYRFAVEPPSRRLRVSVDLRIREEPTLVTRLALEREPLGRLSVVRMLGRYPLMTARVMGSIHWEAFRLWRKGAVYHVKPPYDPARARKGVA